MFEGESLGEESWVVDDGEAFYKALTSAGIPLIAGPPIADKRFNCTNSPQALEDCTAFSSCVHGPALDRPHPPDGACLCGVYGPIGASLLVRLAYPSCAHSGFNPTVFAWLAKHGPEELRSLAAAIITSLPKTLDSRVTQGLMSGWMQIHLSDDVAKSEQRRQKILDALVDELLSNVCPTHELLLLLESKLAEILSAGLRVHSMTVSSRCSQNNL
jgi:hypothetical protein